MEHLPAGIAQKVERVRYIVQEPYDGQGFATFPTRAGWKIAHDGTATWDRSDERGVQDGPRGRFAQFIQSWLYFGLLEEVLRDDSTFDVEFFVEEDAFHIQRVTTKNLQDYLDSWRNRFMAHRPSQRQVLIRVQLALERTRDLVIRYCAVKSPGQSPVWKIDPGICLSIMVLGETLARAKEKIIQASGVNMSGWHSHSSQGWGDSELVLKRMVEDEWCPRSIHILQQLSTGNTISMLYAAFVAQVGSHKIYPHKNCDTKACNARVFNKKDPYPFVHMPPTCTCESIGPNVPEMIQYIKDRKIPLLRYYKDGLRPGDGPRVEVVEFKGNMSYGIVSHVWADGLGNPKKNELPICQLNNLADIFKVIQDGKQSTRTNIPRGHTRQPIPFWIDTLAIPIGEKYDKERKLAIKMMHDTYANADFTLVLDSGLMATNMGSEYADLAMRVTMSGWMRRLWTLQEAVLSKELYFNFCNEYYSMAGVEDSSPKDDEDLLSSENMLARTYYQNILGPERQRKFVGRKKVPTPAFVASVWRAVQYRTTTHPIHETLALAVLLNIDTNPFADWKDLTSDSAGTQKELDNRMQQLLDLLSDVTPCAIPSGMIFLPGPKLPLKGYRWAPRTWLSAQQIDYPDPTLVPAESSRLEKEGLVVKYPGFLLHQLDNERKNPALVDEFWFPVNMALQDWYVVRNADPENSALRPDLLDFEGLAIIALREPSLIQEIAVLVAVTSHRSGILYTDLIRRVWISRETRPESIEKLQTDYGNGSFSTAACGEVLAADQLWCVDGPDPHQDVSVHDDEMRSEVSHISNVFTSVAERFMNFLHIAK